MQIEVYNKVRYNIKQYSTIQSKYSAAGKKPRTPIYVKMPINLTLISQWSFLVLACEYFDTALLIDIIRLTIFAKIIA